MALLSSFEKLHSLKSELSLDISKEEYELWNTLHYECGLNDEKLDLASEYFNESLIPYL